MRTTRQPVLAAGLLLALASCAGSSAEPAEAEENAAAGARPVEASVTYAAVSELAPDFELGWLNHQGGDTLADLRGRVVLVEFWKTW